MSSVIVPPVDLAPGMPSRVVTVSATDVTEGGKSLEGQMVRFALSDTLDVSSGGDVIAKTQAEVVLDANGEGSIRLPVYDENVKTWCGKDWAILVTATWGSHKAIRVPAGTSSIALSALPSIRPLRGRELQWAITGVDVSVSVGDPSTSSGSYSGGILGLNLRVPAGIWSKSAPAGANFDEYYTDAHSGHWYFSASGAAGMSGLPVGYTDKPGSILVLAASSRVATQIYFPYGYYSTAPLIRSIDNVTDRTWTAWGPIGGTPPTPFYRGRVPAGTNLDDWYTTDRNGLWDFSVAGSETMTGLPPGMSGRNAMLMVQASELGLATHTYIPYGYYAGARQQTRSIDNAVTHTWGDWSEIGGGGSTETASTPMVPNSVRKAQFLYAMGGPIDTGGLAAVALRCDHGLLPFRDKVLPLVQSRGIKVSQAYNPRNWHYPENQGVTASDLNGWVAAGDVEIWNHSASHQGADTEGELYEQIVTGLAEIEAELPAAQGQVWGFNPPGVSSGNYGGFNNGASPQDWDSIAGRLILEHHAVGSGYLTGTRHRVLDGTVRDGLSHYTIDSMTVQAIKDQVDQAIVDGSGLQLMLHPSQLDLEGKLTTTQFVEVLDYIVAKRAAGELVTLSPYQMMVADSTSPPVEVADVDGLAARLAALEYKSGPRDITTRMSVQPVSGKLYAERIGDVIWCDISGIRMPNSASFVQLVDLFPEGWRPRRIQDFATAKRNNTDPAGSFRVDLSGTAYFYVVDATRDIRGVISWPTRDAPSATPLGDPA